MRSPASRSAASPSQRNPTRGAAGRGKGRPTRCYELASGAAIGGWWTTLPLHARRHRELTIPRLAAQAQAVGPARHEDHLRAPRAVPAPAIVAALKQASPLVHDHGPYPPVIVVRVTRTSRPGGHGRHDLPHFEAIRAPRIARTQAARQTLRLAGGTTRSSVPHQCPRSRPAAPARSPGAAPRFHRGRPRWHRHPARSLRASAPAAR